jgi:predicted extracellular nuclease
MNKYSHRVFASLLILALAAALLPVQPASAATPAELFFSEYIEGSSNNKALEIYNGTGAAIDLAAENYNVQMHFNGNPTAGLTINLTGVVADGDVYVLAHASANAAILSQADQTNGAGWFNGDDAVVLRKGTTVLDVIGQIGFDPGTEWGAGLASTADNTLRRKADICAGDTDGSNPFDPAQEWDGYATDTFNGLGAHTSNCSGTPPVDDAPEIISSYPANGADDFPINADLTITFSEPVDLAGNWFNLNCSASGIVAATVNGGPTTFTLDPNVDLVSGETCTLTVYAANISDQDTNDPPDNMVVDFSVGFSTLNVCSLSFTPIYDIQGSGLAAAITGTVTTQGVVVGDFEGSSGLQGFYLQDLSGDGNPATSDGIFVFTGNANLVSEGQVVRVTGFARERFDQTTLNGSNSNASVVPAANIVYCGTGSITPTEISLPVTSLNDLEAYEGMLVTFPQELYISEYFNYDRFGEIVLTTQRFMTPTAEFEPGPDAVQAAQNFLLNRITLDDARSAQNPDPAIHPNGSVFDLDNLFRGGDILRNVTGVLGYDFSLYRIQPTQGADYTPANPRTAQPEDVGGNLKVASFNVLNYFTTLNSRGANTPEEFARQRAKIIAALAAIDADVVGLMEIENNTAAIADLVDGLNDSMGPGTYAYLDTGVIGTDEIKVAFIYKPASVSLVGKYAILDSSVDPRFIDTRNRPALAQTFMDDSTGGIFTVVVNHLKSKGSACDGDPDLGNGAGNCNLTRKAAAEALVDWLATDPTGSGDDDFLIIGDLNSYDKEDPIDAILAGSDDIPGTADDYTDLVYAFEGEYAYSYVFDGQLGYLDHALASTGLVDEVTGVTTWHINADEADLIDYDMTFKQDAQDAIYAPDPYRSSDHDPVIIGLNVCDEIAPTLEVSVTPDILWPPRHQYVQVTATVIAADNFDQNPTVELVSITSNEPDNGLGDGDTANDIVILDDFTILLRAERSAHGTGRIYTLTYKVTDACGNETYATATVFVPLNQKK